jgi:hypothetical protein
MGLRLARLAGSGAGICGLAAWAFPGEVAAKPYDCQAPVEITRASGRTVILWLAGNCDTEADAGEGQLAGPTCVAPNLKYIDEEHGLRVIIWKVGAT